MAQDVPEMGGMKMGMFVRQKMKKTCLFLAKRLLRSSLLPGVICKITNGDEKVLKRIASGDKDVVVVNQPSTRVSYNNKLLLSFL